MPIPSQTGTEKSSLFAISIIFFAGFGISSVSVAPSAVEAVSTALASVSQKQAKQASLLALAASTPAEAEATVRAMFG